MSGVNDGLWLRRQLEQIRAGCSREELAVSLQDNIEAIFSTADMPELYRALRGVDFAQSEQMLARIIVAWLAFLSGDNAGLFGLLNGIRETDLSTPEMSSLFYALKALVSGMVNRPQDAPRYARLALDVLPQNERSLYLANAKLTYGQVLAATEQFRQAADMFRAAYDIFRSRGMQFPAVIAFVNEMLNRFHLGEFQQVVDRCNEVLLMAGSFGGAAPGYVGVAHLPLGMCYYELHRPHLAVSHLKQCQAAVDQLKMLHLHGSIELYLFKAYYLLRDLDGMRAVRDAAEASFGQLHYPQMDQLLAAFRILSAEENGEVAQADIDRMELAYASAVTDGHSLVPDVSVWLQLRGLSQVVRPEDLLQRLKRFKYIGSIAKVQLTELQLAEMYLLGEEQELALEHLREAVQIHREYGISACFGMLPLRSLDLIQRLDRGLYALLSRQARPGVAETRSDGSGTRESVRKKNASAEGSGRDGSADSRGTNEGVLSQREREIVRLMAAGKSNAEISRELYISVGTIKWHINQIFSKLEVKNRVQAIEKARALQEI